MTQKDNSLPLSLLSSAGLRATEQPISRLMSAALANPNIISLAAGFVDNATLPMGQVLESAGCILGDEAVGRTALQYGTNAGPIELRREITVRNFEGDPDLSAERMILTAGSNQLLHLVSTCLLEPGDIVMCGSPTYFVYTGLLKDMGVHGYGVETDDQGMIPQALDRRLQEIEDAGKIDRVKMVYLIPYFDNPAGTTLSAARRKQLIEVFNSWHQKSPMVLLCDNAYRDLRYTGDDIPCFTDLGADPDLTIESGTFSKNFAPGIRVGWGVLPQWLLEPALRKKAVLDFGSAHLNQHIMLDAIRSGGFDSQVARLRLAYSEKLEAMVDSCDRFLSRIEGVRYHRPQGGLYVWLELPEGVDASIDSPLWNQCVESGVLYVPGEFCFPLEGAQVIPNSIRLSFGVQPADKIRAGIEILGSAIESVMEAVGSA